MTDFPLTADVVLLNSGETARKGMYVELGLHHEIDGPICPGDRNPFMDLKQGREQGQRFRVTFHLLADDETTTEAPAEEATGTEGWSEAKRKMVQRAALVCKEEAFQNYIAHGYRTMWNHERHRDASFEDRAAYHVRVCCGVKSRSDIDPAEESGARFRDLMHRYHASQQGRTDDALLAQRDRTA